MQSTTALAVDEMGRILGNIRPSHRLRRIRRYREGLRARNKQATSSPAPRSIYREELRAEEQASYLVPGEGRCLYPALDTVDRLDT
ncbi:hypothetical protein EVAR_101095_1 [Eumeta japonica]|uniref:Uncharacterized protein n=1 Tax=Eumeta variegata TaxID=151549 RepID=A0A4C1SHU2_EUMVA|nr:hypothetical protein EVAR_101095_1 [Eumeta japonica]